MTPTRCKSSISKLCISVPLASGALVLGTSAPSPQMSAPLPLPSSLVNEVMIFPHGSVEPKSAQPRESMIQSLMWESPPGGCFYTRVPKRIQLESESENRLWRILLPALLT